MSAKPNPAAYLAAAVALIVVVVIGYVALTLHGDDTGGLLAFTSPVIAALLLAAQVQHVSKENEQRHTQNVALLEDTKHTVDQVQQTSGELDARIRLLVREAITEALAGLGIKGLEVLPVRRATDRKLPTLTPEAEGSTSP